MGWPKEWTEARVTVGSRGVVLACLLCVVAQRRGRLVILGRRGCAKAYRGGGSAGSWPLQKGSPLSLLHLVTGTWMFLA